MNRSQLLPQAGLPGRARRLASGVASFLRQLSLFDTPEVVGPPLAGGCESAAPPVTPAETRSEPANSDFAPLLHGPYAHIEVAVRPRLHESWRVTWVRGTRKAAGFHDRLRLEIPALLAEAPEGTKSALLEWALIVSARKRRGNADAALRARRAELERAIRAHLHGRGDASASPAAALRSARDARKLGRLRPQGECHDLDAILRAVNDRYFAGKLEARITWAARLGGLSTHTIARDGDGKPYHLLTISRGYDVPEATTEIVGGVVYHECLHIAIPPRCEAGRRVVHGPDFRKREREYDHFAVWRKWHREGLLLALRRLQRRDRRG